MYMLHNVYAPTDYGTLDYDPSVPAEEKLAKIALTPVSVIDDGYICSFDLPYGFRADVLMGHDHEDGLITDFGTFDANLRQKGIGARLLGAIFRYAAETRPKITLIATGWARLGYLNTLIKVCGEENVEVENSGFRYGNGTERSLSDIFTDQPPIPGNRYLVQQTVGLIDPKRVQLFEMPVIE